MGIYRLFGLPLCSSQQACLCSLASPIQLNDCCVCDKQKLTSKHKGHFPSTQSQQQSSAHAHLTRHCSSCIVLHAVLHSPTITNNPRVTLVFTRHVPVGQRASSSLPSPMCSAQHLWTAKQERCVIIH
eukprot:7442617-Pyramimonas_sp.AAC.2